MPLTSVEVVFVAGQRGRTYTVTVHLLEERLQNACDGYQKAQEYVCDKVLKFARKQNYRPRSPIQWDQIQTINGQPVASSGSSQLGLFDDT